MEFTKISRGDVHDRGTSRVSGWRVSLKPGPLVRGSPSFWYLAAPIAFKGRLVQYAGRILRPHPGKTTAEVHDYHDTATGVLASSLAKRAPGYTHLGFPDPRRSQ